MVSDLSICAGYVISAVNSHGCIKTCKTDQYICCSQCSDMAHFHAFDLVIVGEVTIHFSFACCL